MTSGVFQTGEKVRASEMQRMNAPGGGRFAFRLATPNHKEGPYNEPTKVLTANPYNIAAGISTVYSTSSTLLNVDTFSLASVVQGEFTWTMSMKGNETHWRNKWSRKQLQ